MDLMMNILTSLISQAAVLVALMSFIGLIAQKAPMVIFNCVAVCVTSFNVLYIMLLPFPLV